MLTWQGAGGFSLDASVRIHGSDTTGRERLLRYCARPPFALERLRIERHPTTAGHDSRQPETAVRQVLYHPPRPTPDGRTILVLSPLDFLAALARLIPPAPRPPPPLPRRPRSPRPTPRARHDPRPRGRQGPGPQERGGSRATVPRHGSRRKDPSPPGPSARRLPGPHRRTLPLGSPPRRPHLRRSSPSAAPEAAATCASLALLTDPGPVDAILRHLGLPTTPPPLSPARGPPQSDLGLDFEPTLELDQTPAFDPSQPEPVADLEFDQSRGA